MQGIIIGTPPRQCMVLYPCGHPIFQPNLNSIVLHVVDRSESSSHVQAQANMLASLKVILVH